METPFSHYKSMGNVLDLKGTSSLVSGPIWPKFEILCMSFLPASIKRIGSKTTEKRWRHFPHYKSMGAFCWHGNQNFDPICPKTLSSLSLTPMMLHIKYDQNWPTGFRDIQVQMRNFRHSRASISKMSGLIRPKFKLDSTFYACPGYQQLWWWFDQKWS